MRKKHRRDPLAALLTVQSMKPVAVNSSRYETPRQRFDREEAEAQERQQYEADAPTRKHIAEQNRLLSELRSATAANLFVNASEHLASMCQLVDPETFVGQDVQTIRVAIRGAFDTFQLELEKDGTRLEKSGADKLRAVTQKNLTINWSVPNNWRVLYTLMDTLVVFGDADRTQRPPETSPRENESQPYIPHTPSAARTSDELEGSGFSEWRQSMYDVFNVVLSEKEQRDCIAKALELNFRMDDPATWTKVRRILYPQLLTPAEQQDRDDQNLSAEEYRAKYKPTMRSRW